jgi:hypothetical protein
MTLAYLLFICTFIPRNSNEDGATESETLWSSSVVVSTCYPDKHAANGAEDHENEDFDSNELYFLFDASSVLVKESTAGDEWKEECIDLSELQSLFELQPPWVKTSGKKATHNSSRKKGCHRHFNWVRTKQTQLEHS